MHQHPTIGHALAVQHQHDMLADAQHARNTVAARTGRTQHTVIRRLLRLVRTRFGTRRCAEGTSPSAANPVARHDIVA